MQHTTHLRFPRGVATLQIAVRADTISVQLYGPREGNHHPQLFTTYAPSTSCWRTASAYPGDTHPEKLFLGNTSIGLTCEEADALDEALRALAPHCLIDREAA